MRPLKDVCNSVKVTRNHHFWRVRSIRNPTSAQLRAFSDEFRTEIFLKIFGAAKIFVRNRASFRCNQRGRTTIGLGGTFAGPCELRGSSA